MRFLILKLQYKIKSQADEIKAVLSNKSGEGFIDTALKILISVVVGALLLAGLYMLFKDTLLPLLSERIKELFNFQG